MHGAGGPWLPALAGLCVFATALAVRALGFGEGVLLGATPASGLALGAALLLRWPGALSSAAGFAAAGLAAELPPAAALADGAVHGLAAALAVAAMRAMARSRSARSRTSDWLIFLAAVLIFSAAVAAGRIAGAPLGGIEAGLGAWGAAGLSLVYEPLGVFMFCAALISFREYPKIIAAPWPALLIKALATFLLWALWFLLSLHYDAISPSGLTLILSVPLCLWVAMQKRSLDGAVLSAVAAYLALWILLQRIGSVTATEYVLAVLYLDLMVAASQLVHAVNLDRLSALAEIEARVEERTARLSAMTEVAQAADAAKLRFLATVSHEVRTPLNGVIGMTSVVLDGPLDAQTRVNVEIIRTSGLHVLDIINRILDYAQIEQGAPTEADIDFDLAGLIAEVLAEARFLPGASGLGLRAELSEGMALRRRGWRQGMRQLLTNLVGNAVKFTDRGAVTVWATDAGGMVRIEVRDTGPGVPEADRARIFRPFEQSGAHMARRGGGTGLGLAICAELVKHMGGTIGVESAPGRGSTFWFEVPLPASEAAEDARTV